MTDYRTSAFRSGFELILPDDCRLDPVPGHSDAARWNGETDEYRAWAATWARPARSDLTQEDTDVNGRTLPRIPRTLQI